MKRTTINDIAAACGMSKSMVAYVLREPESCHAAKETKRRILAAAKKMNYLPNHAARALSSRKTGTVGILFPYLGGYYPKLLVALYSELERRNLYGLFARWSPPREAKSDDSFRHALRGLCERGVDAIIATPFTASTDGIFLPPVAIYGDPSDVFDSVYPDKEDCAERAVSHLLAHGCRRIAFAGIHTDSRFDCILRALKNHGLDTPDELFPDCESGSSESGLQAAKHLLSLKNIPDAVLLHSDAMALPFYRAAGERGICVPEDLSIIGFDDLPEAEWLSPALTTFAQSYETAAKLLADCVTDRVRNPGLPIRNQSFQTTFILRESVRRN